MAPAQLSSSVREDDRHDNVDRDSDRPLWQADQPLCVENLQPELATLKICESEDLEYQLTAVKTRQQARFKREGMEKQEDHDHRMSAKNFGDIDAPLSSLAREDDRHVYVDRDPDRPLWQADRPRCVTNLSPEGANHQFEEPTVTAQTAKDVDSSVCPEPITTGAVNDDERWTKEGLKKAQRTGPEIHPVVEWLLEGARPEWNSILHASLNTKNYWKQWDSLLLKDGVAYRKFVRPDGAIQYLPGASLFARRTYSINSCRRSRASRREEDSGADTAKGILDKLAYRY